MPTEYTLTELANLSGVTPRTIRYYIANGLLSAPTSSGPGARYTEEHLERLRTIKKLQATTHLPLAEIRSLLRRGNSEVLHSVAEAASPVAPSDSASDYIRDVLDQRTFARRAAASPAPPLPNQPAPSTPIAPPASQPERGTWERIALHPDIELHVRRPLSRIQNKRVERLISIARQLLEEE